MPFLEYTGLVHRRNKQDVRNKLRRKRVHAINIVTIKFPTKKKGKHGWKFVAKVMPEPRKKRKKKKRKR